MHRKKTRAEKQQQIGGDAPREYSKFLMELLFKF